MAYRFKRRETIRKGVRRIVRDEIDSAVAELTGKGSADRDEAIHQARKSIKKLRALLRLIETDLGASFDEENERLRNAGRALSSYRDPSAILQSFDDLIHDQGTNLREGQLSSIRVELKRRKAATEAASNLDDVFSEVVDALRTTERNAESWVLEEKGFRAIAPNLERTLRRGARALDRAEREPCATSFHDLRKRVKDYWYQVRLLAPVWAEVMKGYEHALEELETKLGDDHDLVVLRDALTQAPEGFGDAEDLELALDLLDRRQEEMRVKAISLARPTYAERPRPFCVRMKSLWETWKQPPLRLT